MSVGAALFLLLVLALLGAALLFPALAAVRRHRHAQDEKHVTDRTEITAAGVWFYAVFTSLLLAGFAIATLDPESWMGAQLHTVPGALGAFTLLYVAAIVAEVVLGLAGIRLRRRVRSLPGPLGRKFEV